MKKIIALLVVSILLTTSVLAKFGDLKVQVVDDDNNYLEGAIAAPEWTLPYLGWNDFFPKERTTGSDGLTDRWKFVKVGTTVQVNYVTLEGYTCTNGEETRTTSVKGTTVLESICTPDEREVPEFTAIGAGLALLGAGFFVTKRRKK